VIRHAGPTVTIAIVALIAAVFANVRTAAQALPKLHVTYRLVKPSIGSTPRTYSQADSVHLIAEPATSTAAERYAEITRRGDTLRVTLPLAGSLVAALPHSGNWDRNADTALTDPLPYSVSLVQRFHNGLVQRSAAIEIPVRVFDSKFERHVYKPGMSVDRYSLCLFRFDRAELSDVNQRILREYVYPGIDNDAEIEVIGHMDTIGQAWHNYRLSEQRAGAVAQAIMANVPVSRYRVLEERGVGSGERLYTNQLPEGRFYNRTTQVIVYTPSYTGRQ
jgi:outer membrane protein OmpA-like peptidoglycan-associated protein